MYNYGEDILRTNCCQSCPAMSCVHYCSLLRHSFIQPSVHRTLQPVRLSVLDRLDTSAAGPPPHTKSILRGGVLGVAHDLSCTCADL